MNAESARILVSHLLDRLAELGYDQVEAQSGVTEPQGFGLPLPLRTKVAG
ncbi:hypothetical protein [Saccharopolyspora sp. NPDC002376]